MISNRCGNVFGKNILNVQGWLGSAVLELCFAEP